MTFSAQAYLITVCVYGETPSLTSTRTNPPSDILNALLTSLEKSTCPGESTRLIKLCCSSISICYSPFSFLLLCLILCAYSKEMEDAFMVIILCCSSSRESRYLSWPASFWLMIWFELMSESLSVVFPWSTWAKMLMFLTLCVMLWSSQTFSSQVRPFFSGTSCFYSSDY